jgi:NADPH:quinone reductase-like Zn-dependent oxidoreductase
MMKYSLLAVLLYQLVQPVAWAADTMRAVVVTDGKPHMESVPIPVPQAGQLRIRVRAASVNPVDWKLAERAAPGGHTIPGRDLAGIIDAVGADAGAWHKGQSVIAIAIGGAYAEYAIAPVREVALKPVHMSFAEAAGIPVVGETAWRAMVTVGNVQAGQRVLIQGGAGGVGSSALQIAKARGAHVIVTASPSHNALLHSLGADEILDYHAAHVEDSLKNLDVVLNTVDAETGIRSIGSIRSGGVLVSVVGAPPGRAVRGCGHPLCRHGPGERRVPGRAYRTGRSRTVSGQYRPAPDPGRCRQGLGNESQRAHRRQDHSRCESLTRRFKQRISL